MADHEVVSSADWLKARTELLEKEKEFSRLRDQMTQMRRKLPWERMEEDYVFQAAGGEMTLADLFCNCSQLIVYHFMFGPDWPEGCKICSMLGDHYDPLIIHLRHRDVSLMTVSRAPLEKIEAYRQRMGWTFPWVSSSENEFNRDFGVTFTKEEMESGSCAYNYKEGGKFPVDEAPGISSFVKDESGQVYHTYSAYARGLENFLGLYNFLDIVPKGRDEDGLPYSMSWVRQHDKYDDDTFVDPYIDQS